MKKIILYVITATVLFAQSSDNPVKISASFDNVARAGEVIDIKILAEMDKEWHIYSIYKASEGPLPTEISVSGSAVGSVAPVREPKPLIYLILALKLILIIMKGIQNLFFQ